MTSSRINWIHFALRVLAIAAASATSSGAAGKGVAPFLQKHCVECHDADTKKGGLDLTSLKFQPGDARSFSEWVTIHDRVRDGEMPPKKKPQPAPADVEAFLRSLADPLIAADKARETAEGRSTWRRLNRFEYENTLRDLLHAPWLQVAQMLPEDGEALRFNKIGDALDISHVQMARYLAAADYAMRQVMATHGNRPATKITRYYTRDERSFTGKMKFSVFNTAPERATFPVLGTEGQHDVRADRAPVTVGTNDPVKRELEGVGVVAGSYEPIQPEFRTFRAPVAGHYKLRLNALTVWVGPGPTNKWYIPDLDNISPGRRDEPVTMYSAIPPDQLRWLGKFDVTPEAKVHELDVWLLAGESIRPDAGRLFRSRPGSARWHNPLAEHDGQPGVVFRWLEVEGPIYDDWPSAGHKLLFADLPLAEKKPASLPELPMTNAVGRRFDRRFIPPPGVEIVSKQPMADARRLLSSFISRAYRRLAGEAEIKRFLPVVDGALKKGSSFTEAMIAGYSAVLCSPQFVCLEEKPGRLDDFALAARLSYFLWNSAPDDDLRSLAARGQLRKSDVLDAQVDRLLKDSKSRRFVNAFLDYWLDLRRIVATAPDASLYPDYYLDDLLAESSVEETQLFFLELLRGDLPARNVVASDFGMLNERLAQHYGLPPVHGVALQRVPLPKESPRGGLMTQASVLKVTANGTTTSPVLRGAWIMERILGKPPPPPPATVSAVDPDTRGATTIREQLDKHRTQESCNACHAKMDPAGFALESFDVFGGWRDKYRALGDGPPPQGFGKNGQPFAFHYAQPVDASGELPDGRKFGDVRELKRLLLGDERQIARNLTRQLLVYATGAPVHFGDRPEVEQILDRASASGYGTRSLVREIVQSGLFQNK
jgi:mono/diheme cytochrome c family protein